MPSIADNMHEAYGNRADGTPKGSGYFGELRRPDGKVSTELSAGVNFDGQEREIPLIVPTLNRSELSHLLNGGAPTDTHYSLAVEHARQRMRDGRSPFAAQGEVQATPTLAKPRARYR